MSSKREHYEKWFAKRRGPRHPADEAAALAAADVFDQMQKSGKYSDKSLDALVHAASSARGLVWNCGVDLLCATMHRWPQASVAIANMLKSRRANVRFSAICCITKSMPPETATQMIAAGLKDKSGRVRWKAAQEAQSLNMVQVIPQMEEALSKERDKKVRKSIDFALGLLRDGYHVSDRDKDGTRSLCIPVSTGISCKLVDREDLTPEGIARVIRDLQNSHIPRDD
jgi:hypothetical protein